MGDMRIGGAGMAVPQQRGAKDAQIPPAAGGQTGLSAPGEEKETAPSLAEMMREAREKAEAHKKKLELPKNSARYGDAPMEAYARLARARNTAEVNAAAGYARRRIVQLQGALRRDGENAERIRAAISQLQKAVSRAGKKRKDLDREKLTRARQQRAQRDNQRREALRAQQELRRRQAMRVIRESGYLLEAEIDNRLQDQLSATRMELRLQAQALSAAAAPSVDAAIRQYAAQAAPAPAPEAGISLQA